MSSISPRGHTETPAGHISFTNCLPRRKRRKKRGDFGSKNNIRTKKKKSKTLIQMETREAGRTETHGEGCERKYGWIKKRQNELS